MADELEDKILEVPNKGTNYTGKFLGGLGTLAKGAGALVMPPLATFSMGKKEIVGGLFESGALSTMKDLGIINDDFFKDQTLTPNEKAAESVEGSFRKKRFVRAETEFWDRLYDEPCWINPATGNFELETAFSSLWCTWLMEDDPTKQVEKLMDNRGLLFQNVLNTEKLREKYEKKKGIGEDDGFGFGLGEMDKLFYDAVDIFLGKAVEKDGAVTSVKNGGVVNVDTQNMKATPEALDKEALAGRIGLSPKDVEECIEKKAAGPLALLSQTPETMLDQLEDGISNDTQPAECNMGKWWFCFFFKFLLGPAGLLILKILPYVVQLYANIVNFFSRLFLGLTNQVRTAFRIDKKPYVYVNQYNETVENFKPNFFDGVKTYIGLVFPWKILSYDKGQKYGNGEFGKFIFSLMLLSVGLITMGSITIIVFLLVLSFYLVKTLSMFTSNIDSKKKK